MRQYVSAFATICVLLALAALSGCHSGDGGEIKSADHPKDPSVSSMSISHTASPGGGGSSNNGARGSGQSLQTMQPTGTQ